MEKFFQNQKGFTILETVVALSIITVGILGVLELFTQTIRSGELSINQEIATNLAQEGMEVIRGKRDSNNNLVKEIDWNEGISKSKCYNKEISDKEYCRVNFMSNNKLEINQLAGESFEKLYLRSDKIYTHNLKEDIDNKLTIFERQIEIENVSDPSGEVACNAEGGATNVYILKVTSTVQWTERGSLQSIILKDELYNWQ